MHTSVYTVDSMLYNCTTNMTRYNTVQKYSQDTVGVKRMSPVDTELLFIILYNIIALHCNTNIFFYGNQVI